MNRRDIIKTGVIAAAAAGTGLITGSALNNANSNSTEISSNKIIKPKQTGTYNIATPMPFDFKLIDEIAALNKKIKKSKVITLYNNIPNPWAKILGEQFQSTRGSNEKIKTIDDFAKYVKYTQDKGFKFVYLLNSPKIISETDYKKFKEPLFDLLKALKNMGCTEMKVANQQLMEIISNETNFNLAASTSFEYHNVSQYQNLIKTYPRIKTINTAIDDNKNFSYLKNLRKAFPKKNIELIVNEPCIHGCPARISHAASTFCQWDCRLYINEVGRIIHLCQTNYIYPWEFPYYSAIGINNFKVLSDHSRTRISHIDYLTNLLSCVDNGIEGMTAEFFINRVLCRTAKNINKEIMLKDIISEFPDINHFIKYGDKCANICGVECNYCKKCGERLNKILTT